MRLLKKFNGYYFITLFFLIISSNANFIAFDNTYWISFLIFMLIAAAVKGEINARNVKVIGLFTIAYLTFIFCRSFVSELSEEFLMDDTIFLFKYVYISFLFCVVLNQKAISYIVEVVTHLAIFALLCFAIQLFARDTLSNFLSGIHPAVRDNEGSFYYNAIFFTLHVGRHDYRNCGFMWEPGAFACILTLALLFHLFSTKFKYDRKAVVLIITMMTTLSTTGYLALLVIIFLTYRLRVPKFNIWLLALVPVIAGIFFFTPILKHKIISVYQTDKIVLRMVLSGRHPDGHLSRPVPLDRFSSMNYIYKVFGEKLVLGVANNFMVLLDRKYPVIISNGIFTLLAQFGVIGLLYIIYRYTKFCFAFISDWEIAGYCVLLLLICSFSECILNMPFILIFIFLPYVQVKWNTLIIKQQFVKRRTLITTAEA